MGSKSGLVIGELGLYEHTGLCPSSRFSLVPPVLPEVGNFNDVGMEPLNDKLTDRISKRVGAGKIVKTGMVAVTSFSRQLIGHTISPLVLAGDNARLDVGGISVGLDLVHTDAAEAFGSRVIKQDFKNVPIGREAPGFPGFVVGVIEHGPENITKNLRVGAYVHRVRVLERKQA